MLILSLLLFVAAVLVIGVSVYRGLSDLDDILIIREPDAHSR